VRRTHEHPKGTVIAFTDEIDSWLHSNFSSHPAAAELKSLRREVTRLSEENEELRQHIALLQKTKGKAASQG